ncbi:4-hydroxy-tetrahydrodipicolinate reductase [Agaribacter flavus]|uniref:4-hydroxy-tetrahydrodipicolinate reductase n=1 Tax=Agaribacter flavus TaxID=1902781 RepID=A0ABV7FJJ3_9ALTE
MIKVGILGANGRMGRVLIEAVHGHVNTELGFASVRESSSFIGVDAGELAGIAKQQVMVSALSDEVVKTADVLIDFTLPEALEQNLQLALAANKPIVIGTTGLTGEQLNFIDEAAKSIPVVFAANYSVGINLMLNLVQHAASVMGDDADIEIIEGHHRFKKDAPSGTAMAIGHAIANTLGRDLSKCAIYGREGLSGERSPETIGFATVRAGDIVGDHTALFATLGERLEITHKASSRLTFAKGALTAACWLKEQNKGLYSMQDVLGLV